MKKIIALFVVMLAFGINANAQQKKATTAAATQQSSIDAQVQKLTLKDLETLNEFIPLTEDQKSAFKSLFAYKHRTLLEAPNLSDERKSILAENIEMKLKSGIDPDQVGKLDQNPKLLAMLTH